MVIGLLLDEVVGSDAGASFGLGASIGSVAPCRERGKGNSLFVVSARYLLALAGV